MPQTCSAAGCKSRKEKGSKKSFYRIPVNPDQRDKWLAALSRRGWTPTQHSRVCSDHFIHGHPSCDPSHPDYAPSILLNSKHNASPNDKCSVTPPPTKPSKRYLSDADAAEALVHMSKRPRVTTDNHESSQGETENVKANQNGNCLAMHQLQAENQVLKIEMERLRVQRSELEARIRSLEIEMLSLKSRNQQLESDKDSLYQNLQDSDDAVQKLKSELFIMKLIVGKEAVSKFTSQS